MTPCSRTSPHPKTDSTAVFKATVRITLRPSIPDPQGKAIRHALESLGYDGVHDVRAGKLVELWIEADSAEAAEAVARTSAEKLLANPVMEDFTVEIEAVDAAAV